MRVGRGKILRAPIILQFSDDITMTSHKPDMSPSVRGS